MRQTHLDSQDTNQISKSSFDSWDLFTLKKKETHRKPPASNSKQETIIMPKQETTIISKQDQGFAEDPIFARLKPDSKLSKQCKITSE